VTTMNISLSETLTILSDVHVTQGGHASASEYLRTLIREEQRRRTKQELEANFREAVESGPATAMTKEEWVALRQEALDGLA
jgi:antitoxin ParD1/3/4